jgi:hypothetical protein
VADPIMAVSEEIAAQELGHNYGRRHAGCAGTLADTAYPIPSGLLDVWGIDVGRMRLYDPETTYDFMGYCGSDGTTWVSSYTYTAIGRLFAVASPGAPAGVLADPIAPRLQMLQPAAEVLVASGLISPAGVDIHYGFFRLQGGAGPSAGPYTAELRNASGQVLLSHQFGPAQLSDNPAGDSGLFLLSLPWAEGTTSIVFTHNGVEIGRRSISPNAPAVSLLSPNGGEAWLASGVQTIRWSGIDFDGDPLTYIVQYSPDGGAIWKSLAENVSGVELVVDAADVPGGNAGLIRVRASDGFNTAQDTSDSAFTIEGKPPVAYIITPENGFTLPQGTAILFTSMATDREEGPIADDGAFSWSSSLDGSLGQGRALYTDSLSRGVHLITLQARDRDGQVTSAGVTVNVVDALDEQPAVTILLTPETPAPPVTPAPMAGRLPPLVITLGLGLCVLAGGTAALGGLLLALRRRR